MKVEVEEVKEVAWYMYIKIIIFVGYWKKNTKEENFLSTPPKKDFSQKKSFFWGKWESVRVKVIIGKNFKEENRKNEKTT